MCAHFLKSDNWFKSGTYLRMAHLQLKTITKKFQLTETITDHQQGGRRG